MTLDKNALATASWLAANGDFGGAMMILERLVEDKNSPDVMLLKARIYGQQQKYSEAMACCDKILKHHPEHEEAGRCLKELKHQSELSSFRRKASKFGRYGLIAGQLLAIVIVLVIAGFVLGRNVVKSDFVHLYDEIRAVSDEQKLEQTKLKTELLDIRDQNISKLIAIQNDLKTAVKRQNELEAKLSESIENIEKVSLVSFSDRLHSDIENGNGEIKSLLTNVNEKQEENASKASDTLSKTLIKHKSDLKTIIDEAINRQNKNVEEKVNQIRSDISKIDNDFIFR